MSKENILQLFFELINDSLEWGVGNDDYGMYVDGCAAMTGKLLEKIERGKVTSKQTNNEKAVTSKFDIPKKNRVYRNKM